MEISFDLLLLLTSLFALQLQTALALSNDEAPATSNASVCSDKRPCGANEFCTMQNMQFQRGYCIPCPTKENGDPNPFSCVFDVDGLLRAPLYIMNCGKSCDAHMDLVKCKFCPGDVKTVRYGYVDGTMSDDDRCQLCPENDMKHPDMIMSLFGPGFSMKCAQV